MKILLLILLSLVAVPASATNFTVKCGGGGNFTTIDACVSGMSASGGDTCTVFACTYTPSATMVAGTSGNYNVLTVNGTDIVTVNGNITFASHTKIVGNCPTLTGNVITTATCGFFFSRPSSPTSSCVSYPASQITDYWLEYNVFYACHALYEPGASTDDNFGYYIGNTFSYTDTTTVSPNEGCGIQVHGDHKLLEQNEFTHTAEVFRMYGTFNVVRNNRAHDMSESEVTGTNCDTHIDFNETDPGGTEAVQYLMFEGNTGWNCTGANCHMFLTQNANGHALGPTIERFNAAVHIGSSAGGAGIVGDTAWTHIKSYNDDWVDITPCSGGTEVLNFSNNSTNGSSYNDLFYFPEACTSGNAVANDATTIGTFTGGFDLAWCTGGCSGLHGFTYGSGNWTDVVSNIQSDPKFVNYSSSGLGDLHLQAGSPALNAGTYLTTVANTDTGSGVSLTVNDPYFFQDGWGFPAGLGVGQMQADTICVTTVSNCVQINAGGVNYSTGIITLASGITRSVGDKVWLQKDSTGTTRLTGSAPNIGAFGQASSPPSPNAPATTMFALK